MWCITEAGKISLTILPTHMQNDQHSIPAKGNNFVSSSLHPDQHGSEHTSPSSAEFKNSYTHLQGMALHYEQGLDLPLCFIKQHAHNCSTTL